VKLKELGIKNIISVWQTDISHWALF